MYDGFFGGLTVRGVHRANTGRLPIASMASAVAPPNRRRAAGGTRAKVPCCDQAGPIHDAQPNPATSAPLTPPCLRGSELRGYAGSEDGSMRGH